MTQQPYYPPQPGQGYAPPPPPQQYQQPYAPAPQQPAPPPYQQPYPQPGYGQAPQGYGQPYQQPAPPQQPPPPINATMDDFYSQPSTGGGKGISWQDAQGVQRPNGTTFAGVVARDVTKGDLSQVTNRERVPQNYADGRPKLQMKVPLEQVAMFDPYGQPTPLPPEFTDGIASWYVKGQGRDELVRAMSEAKVAGEPKAGDVVTITLVQRRPNGPGMNPSNIVRVSYQPGPGWNGEPAQQAPQPPAQPTAQHEAPPQWAQPQPQGQPQAPPAQQGQQPPTEHQVTYPQGVPAQQPQGQPQYQPPGQPQGQPQPQGVQQPTQQFPGQPPMQQPAQGQPQGYAPPPLDPNQAAMLAQMTGQPMGQPQQGAA